MRPGTKKDYCLEDFVAGTLGHANDNNVAQFIPESLEVPIHVRPPQDCWGQKERTSMRPLPIQFNFHLHCSCFHSTSYVEQHCVLLSIIFLNLSMIFSFPRHILCALSYRVWNAKQLYCRALPMPIFKYYWELCFAQDGEHLSFGPYYFKFTTLLPNVELHHVLKCPMFHTQSVRGEKRTRMP